MGTRTLQKLTREDKKRHAYLAQALHKKGRTPEQIAKTLEWSLAETQASLDMRLRYSSDLHEDRAQLLRKWSAALDAAERMPKSNRSLRAFLDRIEAIVAHYAGEPPKPNLDDTECRELLAEAKALPFDDPRISPFRRRIFAIVARYARDKVKPHLYHAEWKELTRLSMAVPFDDPRFRRFLDRINAIVMRRRRGN